MLNNQELTALLRQNGYKVTPQRLAVYEALANTKQHPSAEMLFGTLQPKYPSMSFATVYKTVEILNKLGLIQIINTGEDSFRYDADISEHSHVQCTVCGRVDDVPALNDRSLVVKVEEASGYSIDKHQFYFFGVCEKCRKNTEIREMFMLPRLYSRGFFIKNTEFLLYDNIEYC